MNAALADPYDLLAGEMRTLVEQEGLGLWNDRRRLVALLLDHQPDLRREIRAIGTAVDEGVAAALARCQRQLAGIAIDRQAQLVESEAGLRPNVARDVTRAIAHALDLGPLPGVYPREANIREERTQPPRMPDVAAVHRPPHGWDSAGLRPVPAGGIPKSGIAAAATALIVGGAILFGGVPGITNPPQKQAETNIGEELTDWGVPGQAALQANVGSATPLAIPAGKRVTTGQVRAMIQSDPNTLLIDVLANAHPTTLQGAHYLPTAGAPGDFTDAAQTDLKNALGTVTANNPARPLVFFCAGARCWESYNATLRAAQLGYTSLFWYRGGLKSWEDARLPMQALAPQQTKP